MKCIKCGAKVKRVTQDGNEYYLCSQGHLEPRVIHETSNVLLKQVHVSVGAIIKQDNKVLLLNRRKYPFAHTIPAGHLEQGEEPSKAVKREVKEETGLELRKIKLLKHYPSFYDPCKGGIDYHEWYLYESNDFNGELKRNDESKTIQFHKPAEIKKLKLTIPTNKFLKEQKII